MPDVTLTIVGSAIDNKDITDKAETLNGRVKFTGEIENFKIPEIINQSEIYVQPSRYEGNPKSILEAMACRVPVIASNVEGINNIINHKENGLLCESDVQSIKQSIEMLLSDKQLQDNIAQNGYKYVKGNCSLDTTTAKEYDVYNKLMDVH